MANAAVNADPGVAERPSLTLTRRLRARPEKVYAAWTQAEQLMQWFGPPNMKPATLNAELDVRTGGHYRISFTRDDGEYFEARGTYREVVPNEPYILYVHEPGTFADPVITIRDGKLLSSSKEAPARLHLRQLSCPRRRACSCRASARRMSLMLTWMARCCGP